MSIIIPSWSHCMAGATLVLLTATAHAQSPQPLQELFQSDVVFPQEENELQISLAPRYHAGRGETEYESRFELEYGITDALQIGAEWDAFVRNAPSGGPAKSGPGDAEINAKYSWMQIGNSGLHAALGLGLEIPTGRASDDLGSGQFELASFALLSADIPFWTGGQVFTEFGAQHNDGSQGNPRKAWFANFGFFVPFRQLAFTSEWNFSEDKDNYYTPGLVWRSPHNFEIGLGVPIGLHGNADPYRVILSITREFGL